MSHNGSNGMYQSAKWTQTCAYVLDTDYLNGSQKECHKLWNKSCV
jgi:hypothetical protein